MKSTVYGFSARAVALAATLGLSLHGPHRAVAAPAQPVAASDLGPAVTILSPVPRTEFSGVKPVEISAFYQGAPGNRIAVVELYVDGVKAAQKVLDTPEPRGVVSFLVDAGALTGGTHRIVVRASAEDAEIAFAKSSFLYSIPSPERPDLGAAPAVAGQGAPTLTIQNPATEGQVQGKVTIRIEAQDPSGKPPYVSLFIDHGFKTLRNYAPYEFTWDTTGYPNGYHTIEAFGYNDAQNVGHAQPLRILVNNPGGRTERRTDLRDAPKPAPRAQAVPKFTAPRVVLPASVREALSAPIRAKAAQILRRPTPALLAQVKHKATAAQMATLPGLVREELALTGLPGLSDPFVADAARSRAVTPTRGFKPLVSSLKSSSALLAVGTTAAPLATQPHLMRVAKAVLPAIHLSSKFLTSPSLPRLGHLGLQLALHTPRPTTHANWMHAVGQTSVMFNSSRLPLDRPLHAEGSVLFGPLRQIFQSGGGSLLWQARTGVVTAHTAAKDIQLTMGQKTAVVNRLPVILDGAPYINQGRTMVPLSFLKSAMDVTVQYDPATGHLLITSNK